MTYKNTQNIANPVDGLVAKVNTFWHVVRTYTTPATYYNAAATWYDLTSVDGTVSLNVREDFLNANFMAA